MPRLSVSALAWPGSTDPEASPAFATLLARHGVARVDLVPTLVWPDWRFGHGAIRGLRTRFAEAGISVCGMQSIFFKRGDLNIFADADGWRRTRNHLARLASLAGQMGISAVAFGAPANRDPRSLEPGEAWRLALARLREIAPVFLARGAVLCLEPVPSGAFLRDHEETASFVRDANVAGLGMVLDTAALHATVADPVREVARFQDVIRHVHASEPGLGDFSDPVIDHDGIADALRRSGYDGFVALEMMARGDACLNLDTALDVLDRSYGRRE
jgi:sugar phosphate isomerase/epimerase